MKLGDKVTIIKGQHKGEIGKIVSFFDGINSEWITISFGPHGMLLTIHKDSVEVMV